MQKKIIIVILILIIVFLYNQLETSKTARLNEKFVIKQHETVKITNTDIKIKLESIADSRCPSDVLCTWQGELSYSLEITTNKKSQKYSLGEVTNPEQHLKNKYVLILEESKPDKAVFTLKKHK